MDWLEVSTTWDKDGTIPVAFSTTCNVTSCDSFCNMQEGWNESFKNHHQVKKKKKKKNIKDLFYKLSGQHPVGRTLSTMWHYLKVAWKKDNYYVPVCDQIATHGGYTFCTPAKLLERRLWLFRNVEQHQRCFHAYWHLEGLCTTSDILIPGLCCVKVFGLCGTAAKTVNGKGWSTGRDSGCELENLEVCLGSCGSVLILWWVLACSSDISGVFP